MLTAASMVMALAISAAPALNASPLAVKTPVVAKFGKTKMVSFSLRNDSKSTVKVTAGANTLTLEPGKATATKLAVGDKVVIADGSDAGRVLVASVSSDLSDTTVAFR